MIPSFGLNAPGQLLYLCALRDIPLPAKELSELVFQVEDWDVLLRKAAYHRLQPRLYLFLKRNGARAFLKVETWRKIERTYFQAQAYTLALKGELIHVLLPQFNESGIDVLLLKGAALMQTVYKENPVRYFVDLDLLVRKKDFLRVQTLLEQKGYEMRSVFPGSRHRLKGFPQEHRVPLEFVHPERGIHVDLHSQFFEPWSSFHLDSEDFWETAQPIFVEGIRTLIPNENIFFVHLLLHTLKHAKHNEHILGWYLDLDEYLRYFNGQIKEEVYSKAIDRMAPHTLELLKIFSFIQLHFGSPLPDSIASLLRNKKIGPPPLKSIFDPPSQAELITVDFRESSERFLFFWKGLPEFQKKLTLLWQWAFPHFQYVEKKYRAFGLLHKIGAYFRHFLVMMLKALGLGIYLLARKR